jgi:tRNA threonylcarbamoyl adenosine modification protein YeaZ
MIIALESASSDPSIALAAPDGTVIAADGWSSDGRQGSDLLPRLLGLLAAEGRELREATAVAVGIGPGSFTGLRVAMSVAKGLAVALAIPVSGVPSLVAWLAAEPAAGAAVARAGASEAFLLQRGEAEPRIVSAAELRAIVRDRRMVVPSELAAALELVDVIGPHRAAAAIAAIAAARLAADPAGDDLERLEPAYLRAPRGMGTSSEVPAWP